ncbi:hypothetical protein J113_23585 [Mycobacterium tuberculosis CAS/NITR204]|uniref:Pyridoxamine 5'-phosphate oxidase N-terminal domain-containing protein n=1 Tax=Mycobacterium tuberculosis CAS/NITR204 TaxID=1310114 RepID=R4MIT7_MYCTX|nr:hypothetical protein J113_23585 [Mycobacterium tuberculosis CAS/NITR204]
MWFYFDGTDLTVYSMPQAAKVAHITAHPQVSLNLDSDGNGAGIIVVGGTAAVVATDVDCRDDAPYWAKYREDAAKFGLTEAIAAYSTRLKIDTDPGVDDAHGLSGLAPARRQSEIHDAFAACRVARFTVGAEVHRKSRERAPTARVRRPIRSATTVIAPLAFWTWPRISSAGAVCASLRCRAHTPGVQSTLTIPVSSSRLMNVTPWAVAGRCR